MGSMGDTVVQDAVVQVVRPEGSIEHTPEQDAMAQVVLPEMFPLFLAQSPRVNPHYNDTRRESEAWLLKSVSGRFIAE